MWRLLLVLGTGCATIALFTRVDRLPGPVASGLAPHLGLPARWEPDTASWLWSGTERRMRRLGCAVFLLLPIVGVLAVGWLKGLGALLATGIATIWLSTKGRSPAGPLLLVAAARARQRASALRESGHAISALAAEDLALRIDRFQRQNPELTVGDVARLPERHRPTEVADTLELWWRGRSTGVYWDDADMGFTAWLKSREWTPFADDPTEQRRVQLLERVKQELIAGGGEQFADETRLTALVAELRAFEE
jgi:hypothetical protein